MVCWGKKIVNLCFKIYEKVFLLGHEKGCWEENVVNVIREIHVMCSKSTEERNLTLERGSWWYVTSAEF